MNRRRERTGTQVQICHGRGVLTLAAAGRGRSRLARVKRRRLIAGDAGSLWKVKVWRT